MAKSQHHWQPRILTAMTCRPRQFLQQAIGYPSFRGPQETIIPTVIDEG